MSTWVSLPIWQEIQKAALELQQRGLEMRESLVAADPLNTDLRLMLIESHRYVGDMFFKLGDLERASESLPKAIGDQ